MSNKKQEVEIFWTGGYDSTFRVVQLSRMDVVIRPYYLSDNRVAESYEISAIEKITSLIRNHPDTRAELLDLVYIPVSERPETDPVIGEAYKRIFSQNWLGNQYVWLATFAKQHKGIELSIEKGTNPVRLIEKNGGFKKIICDGVGDSYAVDEKTHPDYYALFGNFTIPLLDISKLDMKAFFLQHGYEDVMKATWFCHSPIDGKPCGKCNPCKGVVEEGMAERLDDEALVRYKKAKKVEKIKSTAAFKLAKKILRR